MTWSDHTHSEYAGERHDHDLDYAEKHHRHHDLEREDERLKASLDHWQVALRELRADLEAALERIRVLEAQTPEARQAEYQGRHRHGRRRRVRIRRVVARHAR